MTLKPLKYWRSSLMPDENNDARTTAPPRYDRHRSPASSATARPGLSPTYAALIRTYALFFALSGIVVALCGLGLVAVRAFLSWLGGGL